MSTKLRELRRLRWVVLIVVLAGIATSVALNVMHAPHNNAARFVAALPPLAVFGVIELVSRIPSSSRLLSATRVLASFVVSSGGAAVSYVQQLRFVESLGFDRWVSQTIPVIIDGTMVVATLSLVEVVRKIRQVKEVQEAEAESPAQRRLANDAHESPATLAYRRDVEKLRRDSAVASLNGKSPDLASVA